MISTKILLYKHKTLSDGKHPIVMQAIHNGKRKNISLGFKANLKEWNTGKACFKRTVENAETKNLALSRYKLLAQKIVDEALLSGKPISNADFSFFYELSEEMKMAWNLVSEIGVFTSKIVLH